jgi:hypothetical protein
MLYSVPKMHGTIDSQRAHSNSHGVSSWSVVSGTSGAEAGTTREVGRRRGYNIGNERGGQKKKSVKKDEMKHEAQRKKRCTLQKFWSDRLTTTSSFSVSVSPAHSTPAAVVIGRTGASARVIG